MDVNLLVRFFVIQISFLHHSSHIPMEMHTQSSDFIVHGLQCQ